MLRNTPTPLKRTRYPHSIGELDFHQTTCSVTQNGRFGYLPLSAVTGGRFSTATKYLLRQAQSTRGFRSQFWITQNQLVRRFPLGAQILPEERQRGCDIGLGRGPIKLYHIDDIASSDLQLFLRSFPLPSPVIDMFDCDEQLNAYQTGVPRGHHLIFDGLKWSRYRAPELNAALDELLKHFYPDVTSGGGQNKWLYADVVHLRSMNVVPGARPKHAFERAAHLFLPNQSQQQQAAIGLQFGRQQHHQQQQQQQQQKAEEDLWMKNATSSSTSLDSGSKSSEWDAAVAGGNARQQQQQQETERFEELCAISTAAGCVLFNAEQTNMLDEIEAHWRGHIPPEDVSEITRLPLVPLPNAAAAAAIATTASHSDFFGGWSEPQQKPQQLPQQQLQQQHQSPAALNVSSDENDDEEDELPVPEAPDEVKFWASSAPPIAQVDDEQPQHQRQEQQFEMPAFPHMNSSVNNSNNINRSEHLTAAPPLDPQVRQQILGGQHQPQQHLQQQYQYDLPPDQQQQQQQFQQTHDHDQFQQQPQHQPVVIEDELTILLRQTGLESDGAGGFRSKVSQRLMLDASDFQWSGAM